MELNLTRDEHLERNKKFLSEFETYLKEKTLDKKYYDNSKIYINEFLLIEEPFQSPELGVFMLSGYLGDWLIKNKKNPSKELIKEHANSLEIFYEFMVSKKYLEKDYLEKIKADNTKDMEDYITMLEYL